jgi:HAD superfamily hydrolase (TIGR01662 family)
MAGVLKAVLLDFDGTIVKSMLNSQQARAEIMDILVRSGLSKNIFRPECRISEIFNKVEEYLNNKPEVDDREKVKEFKEKAWQIVEKYEMESAMNTILIDGVPKVLEELREKGLRLVVVTNNSTKPTAYALRKIGLAGFFDLVLTREYTQFMKPHPQPIQEALKRLKIQPSEAVFVGDSIIDIKASQEAGVLAVGVTTGVGNEETLKTNGSKYVISSMKELIPIINELN